MGDLGVKELAAFPASLGPFGVAPMQLRPTVVGNTYKIRFEGALAEGLQSVSNMDGLRGIGNISPKHPVTLSGPERELAEIPPEATNFCWAYPLPGVRETPKAQLDAISEESDLDDNTMLFIRFGGFLYFDDTGMCVRASTVGSGTSLFFHPAERWPAEFTHALHKAERFQRITIMDLLKRGARCVLSTLHKSACC